MVDIVGSWSLVAWRRIEGDTVTYPLGEDATGLLIYVADHTMAVVLTAANRPAISTGGLLGGDQQEQAAAYATCLAYFGTYEVQEDSVVHHIIGSLFPNWSGAAQVRPFTLAGSELVLRTPPTAGPAGTVVNEMSWVRKDTQDRTVEHGGNTL